MIKVGKEPYAHQVPPTTTEAQPSVPRLGEDAWNSDNLLASLLPLSDTERT